MEITECPDYLALESNAFVSYSLDNVFKGNRGNGKIKKRQLYWYTLLIFQSQLLITNTMHAYQIDSWITNADKKAI